MKKMFYSGKNSTQHLQILKSLFVVSCAAVLLMLAACSSKENLAPTSSSSQPAQASSNEASTLPELSAESKIEDAGDSEFYFKDNILQIRDAKIEIYDHKIIPVGETGNEYGKNPVIAFWYKTTNLSDKEISALMIWMACFKAIQDNDPNIVNELGVGLLPDDAFRETQTAKIKKGGTIECAVAYELDDMETPVILRATQGIMGDVLGEQVFDVK